MSEENKNKWDELSPTQRIEYFEKVLHKDILFTIKLLFLDMENLKKMDESKHYDSIELVEEAYINDLMKLGKTVKDTLLYITKE